MNQGVEILLARMDSHPQEFTEQVMYGRYGGWSVLVGIVLTKNSSFTDEEREAVDRKLNLLAREHFTQEVMRKLLEGPEGEPRGEDTVLVRRPITNGGTLVSPYVTADDTRDSYVRSLREAMCQTKDAIAQQALQDREGK
jgi:hypothetical protein